MAKLHDKSSKARTRRSNVPARATDPEILLVALQTFISNCSRPAVLEPGEDPMPLCTGNYVLEPASAHVLLEVWDERRSVSRRIIDAKKNGPGLLDCSIVRFGSVTGKLTILDADRPQTSYRMLRGSRETFAEQFRRMLNRQFPGCEIAFLGSAPDLQRSFSPIFPRARLQCGNRIIAALACPAPENEPALLSFALIWFDHVRRHAPAGSCVSLILFLPEISGRLTAHRLRFLDTASLACRVFLFNENGSAGEVDPLDLGNLDTRVSGNYTPSGLNPSVQALLTRMLENPNFGYSTEFDGSTSVQFRGLEFARIENSRILVGIEERQTFSLSQFDQINRLALQLEALCSRTDRLGTSGPPAFPERWLESQIRRNIALIDASLLANPVHGQVLTFAGGDRDLIDLLGISSSGRLAVLELKCSEDIHLPLQALDYWTRIKWHAERRELAHLFPDARIQPEAPKLLLIAPAMAFHPSNEVVLRYFSPEIEVERVGVNSGWRENLRVVMRLKGSSVPQCHADSAF